MLISYQHQFIFIHVYKVAGTSVTRALQPFAPQPAPSRGQIYLQGILKTVFKKAIKKPFTDHETALQLRQKLPPEIFDNFFKFAFVRNPWDWQVSLYYYTLEKKDHFQHQRVKDMSEFDEYIRWRLQQPRRLQKDFITDEQGNLIVDYIGRFENLECDFRKITEFIGIAAELPHVNRSNHGDYRRYYNSETRQLIGEAYKEDIEFFQYRF